MRVSISNASRLVAGKTHALGTRTQSSLFTAVNQCLQCRSTFTNRDIAIRHVSRCQQSAHRSTNQRKGGGSGRLLPRPVDLEAIQGGSGCGHGLPERGEEEEAKVTAGFTAHTRSSGALGRTWEGSKTLPTFGVKVAYAAEEANKEDRKAKVTFAHGAKDRPGGMARP